MYYFFSLFFNMSKRLRNLSFLVSGAGFYWLAGIGFMTFVTVFSVFSPLVLSIDSASGFLAYKGTVETGIFNVAQDVSQEDISVVNNQFVSWWSPGQWIYPGILSYFLGLKMGAASIIVTIVFSILGLWGFYKVFVYFNFTPAIIVPSIVAIILSNTFYNSFIFYQGGEILSFGVFPWFLLFVLRLRNINILVLLGVFVFFLLCFISKITLVLYCALAILFKIVEPLWCEILKSRNVNRHMFRNIALVIPLLAACWMIYFAYLSKGAHIPFFNTFHIEVKDFLAPLASPFLSFLSFQTIIFRIEKLAQNILPPAQVGFIQLSFYFFVILLAFRIIFFALKKKLFPASYERLLLVLMGGSTIFFIVSQMFDTNDYTNSRHYKLLGYLLVPAIFSLLRERLKHSLSIIVGIFCLYSVFDVIYSKNKWTHNRYISANYFYRNYDNLDNLDNLDQTSYKVLMELNQEIPKFVKGRPVVFFVEATPDIAIDLMHRTVFDSERVKFGSARYNGNGATVYMAVSHKTLVQFPDIIRQMLPDYPKADIIKTTGNYLFYKLE